MGDQVASIGKHFETVYPGCTQFGKVVLAILVT